MKKRSLLLFFLVLALLTGCWDQKDIETRGYVLGLAIDHYPPTPHANEKSGPEQASAAEEEKKLERMQLHTGEPVYAMTIQLPLIAKAESQSDGWPGGGQTAGSRTWEITQLGNSFFSMNREMASRTSLSLYYEHLQVIIISEEVAKKGMLDILDFFLRDPEMRRRVKIFISQGEAKSILDVVPRTQEYSSVYLAMILTNSSRNSRTVYHTDLGELICNLHDGHDFILGKVVSTEDEIKTSGGAVFRKDKMVGWATEMEMEAIHFIRNRYEGGILTVSTPEGEEGLIALEITSAKSRITPVIKGDQVSFHIEIKVEGDYSEDINLHGHEKLDVAFLKSLKKQFEKEIRKICLDTIERMQEEYGADVFHFDRVLQTEEPAYWKRMGSQWDSIFPNVEVAMDVEVDIVLLGI